MTSPNGKADKFRKLAGKRVQKVLQTVDRTGNLSKRSLYDFSDEQVDHIFNTMRGALDVAERRFKDGPRQLEFTLD